MVNKNSTVAIIQARYNSTRFPGKIFSKIRNKSVLEILLYRLKLCKNVDEIIIACSDNKLDKKIINFCKRKKIKFYVGSEQNVLSRYYKTAKKFHVNNILRITSDCPLIDPDTIDQLIKNFNKNRYDYGSNVIDPTYPDGLDAEIFKFNLLKKRFQNSKDKFEIEHVTPNMQNKKKYKVYSHKLNQDFSMLRLTLDTHEDLLVLKKLFTYFKYNFKIKLSQIIDLYKKNPKFFGANSQRQRNENLNLNLGQKLWKRAQNIIPGGNMMLSKRPEMFLPNLWPTYYKKAKGCFIWDMENNKYTDMSLMSVGTNVLGYANKYVNSSVIKSINNSNMSSLNCPEEIFLTEKLLDMHKHFHMARYAKTGGEANAIAIRIARAASGKDKVAICGYHGWHDWYLSANYQSKDRKGVLKDHLLEGLSTAGVPKGLKNTIYPFKFNDFESLKKICTNNKIGAIKMEIFRNIKPRNNFLEKVKKLAKEKNIILIFDECTSGFRETFGGLHLKYNIIPDICILGKALGNGFPITVVLGKREVMEYAQNSFISSTFWTERTGYVAALKTLEIMDKIKSWKIISKQGLKIKKKLMKIATKNQLNIEFTGLSSCPSYMINSKNWIKYKTFITQELLKKNFLGANSTYVSICHSDKIIEKYANMLDEIFFKIKNFERDKSNIDQLLKTPLSHTTFKRLN